MAVARARRTPGVRANRVGERFARALYRYLPLALGAGGIAAGLYWLVQGVGGTAGVLALALLVGAETEVAVWLGYLLWRRRHAPAPESVESPAPVGVGMFTEEVDTRPVLPEAYGYARTGYALKHTRLSRSETRPWDVRLKPDRHE